MEMTISAVMVGASSQPQSKASDTGFSDILTEVRAAAPQMTENAVRQTSDTAESVYSGEVSYTDETEITAEIEETVMTELKNTVISLVSKASNGSKEENDRIISALLDILKKMQDDSDEDPVMNLIMELLASMSGETADSDLFSLNLNITEFSASQTTEITAILSSETTETPQTDAPAAFAQVPQTVPAQAETQPVQQFVQTVQNVQAEAEISAEMQTAAPVTAEQTPQTAPVQSEVPQTADNTAETDYTGLLKDILSVAREELGLTKAELTVKQPVKEPAVSQEMPQQVENQPRAEQTAFTFALNRKDGTDELNSILGASANEQADNTEDTAETKTAPVTQDNSAALAGNIPQRTEAVTAETEIKVEAPLPEQQIADEILAKPETFEGGRTEFTMELNPESLGKITVRLVSTEGRVEVNISAENDSTRQLLESRAENIGTALRNNGVELERYQVVSGQEEAMLMQESYDGSSRNPYGRNDEEQPQDDSEEDFLEILQQI